MLQVYTFKFEVTITSQVDQLSPVQNSPTHPDHAQAKGKGERTTEIETKPGTLLQQVSTGATRIEDKHESVCSTTTAIQGLETSHNTKSA